MKRLAAAAAFALVMLVGLRVSADDGASWKQRGDEAMDAGRAAEALEAYRRAAAIAPSPSLDYNVGRALRATGDFVGALEAFEHYEATAPEDLRKKTHRLAEVIAELRQKIVTVEIRGDAGGRVVVDGREACTLPCAPMRHNPGWIEVRVEREDHRPWLERRELAPGGTVVLEAKPAPLPIEASLVVVVRPVARVTLDGRVVGTTPTTLAIAPGAHEVVLDAAGSETKTTTLVLGRGESRRLEVDLAPEKRAITSRWWFWTGIGAVLVGGTVAAIALTTERSPREGSLGTVHVP